MRTCPLGFRWGTESSDGPQFHQPLALPSAQAMTALVPVRARPQRPAGDGHSLSLQGGEGSTLLHPAVQAHRSQSPHHVLRSPFEESQWDTFALSSVIQGIRSQVIATPCVATHATSLFLS